LSGKSRGHSHDAKEMRMQEGKQHVAFEGSFENESHELGRDQKPPLLASSSREELLDADLERRGIRPNP